MSGKKAFIVGINDYKPVGIGGSDLNGCVNDAMDVIKTLALFGFNPQKEITLCTDARATRDGIMHGLDWLLDKPTAGDVRVFYYSGHGSYVPDNNGDEIDGRDEILCPHDTDFTNKTYITDDVLSTLFLTLPKDVLLEVILDSCHSGTATRNPGNGNGSKIKFLPPPIDIRFPFELRPSIPFGKRIAKNGGIQRTTPMNHILWAACRDNQTSQETQMADGEIRGAFTYWFCKILRKANGAISRKKLYSVITENLYGKFEQVPQIEVPDNALLSKNIFSV